MVFVAEEKSEMAQEFEIENYFSIHCFTFTDCQTPEHATCGSVVFVSSLKQILPPYFLVSAVIVDGGVGFLPKVTAVLDQEHPCGSTLPKRR